MWMTWAAEKATIHRPITRLPTVKTQLRASRSWWPRVYVLRVPKIWPPMPMAIKRAPIARVIQAMVPTFVLQDLQTWEEERRIFLPDSCGSPLPDSGLLWCDAGMWGAVDGRETESGSGAGRQRRLSRKRAERRDL